MLVVIRMVSWGLLKQINKTEGHLPFRDQQHKNSKLLSLALAWKKTSQPTNNLGKKNEAGRVS